MGALLGAVLIAAIVVPSHWATQNRPLYDYIYPAVLWWSMLLFAIWPGIARHPRSDRLFIAIIITLFLVTRLAWVLLVPSVPFSDFAEYNLWAMKLGQFQPIHGEMFRLSIQLALQPWLYPISLGVLYDIFGQHLIVAKLANVVAGGLSIWLLYKLANHLFGSHVARVSAILFLLWPSQLMFSSVLASEHLALVLALCAFVPLVNTLRDDKADYRGLIIAGFFLGLSYTTRYAVVLAIPSFILALALTRRSFRLKLTQGAVLVGAFLITFLLYLGVVAAIYRQVHLPDSGLQLLEGTNFATGGAFTIEDTHLFEAQGTLAEANQFARAEAFRRIKSHPTSFMVLMGNKVVTYWKDDFYGPQYSTHDLTPGRVSAFLTATDRSLLAVSQFFHLTILCAAVLGGLYILLGGGEARLIMIFSVVLGGTLMHSILVVHSRYHYASEPLIIILAAYGLVSLTSITVPGFTRMIKLKRGGLQDGNALANLYRWHGADGATQTELDSKWSHLGTWKKSALFALLGSLMMVVLFFSIFGGSDPTNRGQIVPPTPNAAPLSSGGTEATIALDSNPVKVCDGSALGTATVSFAFPESMLVEVRINSPDGALFARPGVSGKSTTGKWVNDGMTFFLQDVTGEKALTAENTLATASARLTTEGCQ
jgi:4-amino-4-deoxy-L-arabinose transferase-like glycosyltransferase